MDLDDIKRELREKAPGFAARVAPVYAALGWEWSPHPTEPHIPLVPEIESTLYHLIDGLAKDCQEHGTGGLHAYYEMPDENGAGRFGLGLRIEDEGFFDK